MADAPRGLIDCVPGDGLGRRTLPPCLRIVICALIASLLHGAESQESGCPADPVTCKLHKEDQAPPGCIGADGPGVCKKDLSDCMCAKMAFVRLWQCAAYNGIDFAARAIPSFTVRVRGARRQVLASYGPGTPDQGRASNVPTREHTNATDAQLHGRTHACAAKLLFWQKLHHAQNMHHDACS